jgi:hypothetical protein
MYTDILWKMFFYKKINIKQHKNEKMEKQKFNPNKSFQIYIIRNANDEQKCLN